MKVISGHPNSNKIILGRLTKNRLPLAKRSKAILITTEPRWTDVGYAGIITNTSRKAAHPLLPVQVSVESLKDIPEDDVVLVTNGDIHFLWEAKSRNNGLLLTEACNCRCLMCPQPPKPFNAKQIQTAMDVLALSPPDFDGEICLTGGEPTLCGDRLFELLKGCHERHPRASIIMLTNGKRFSEFSFAKQFAAQGVPVKIAVSLHADADTLHDKVVGTEGSFRNTQQGLYNLAKLGQNIEIRVVVSKLNYARLPQVAQHIYRNYPFAAHVTFMALEVTGYAQRNYETVWIDPFDYKDILEDALHTLHRSGMRVSAYNHPLCLLPQKAWPFARKSISEWKNNYIPVCEDCSVRDRCCGVFTTSGDKLSRHIHPIVRSKE